MLSKQFVRNTHKFAEFIKRKDIDMRYEGMSRFFMEILLTLSIAIWINLIYGDFCNIFNIISYAFSIVLLIGIFWIIIYWFSYPAIYYFKIQTHPDKHERHFFIISWI